MSGWTVAWKPQVGAWQEQHFPNEPDAFAFYEALTGFATKQIAQSVRRAA